MKKENLRSQRRVFIPNLELLALELKLQCGLLVKAV